MLQKIEIYEWGRYSDGSQTEPELVADYFFDPPSYPPFPTYRFERGPYSPGGPSEIHFEVAAWDYAGNPQSRADVFRVIQFEAAPFVVSPAGWSDYYVGTIAEVVSSKDSDDGQGELHPSFNIEMVGTDGELYREFKQDYPYFKHVEADASNGRPLCAPWVPVLAVRQPELHSCIGYTLHAHIYESDSPLERVIRLLETGFEHLIDAIRNTISCIVGDMGGCTDLICDIFVPGNDVGKALCESQDDYIGSAHFITTMEANFGISDNPFADYYTFWGSPDAGDLDWVGTTVEGAVEGVCRNVISGRLWQGQSEVAERGDKDNWIEVIYHPEVVETRPMEKIKVKFVGGDVLNDRDGSSRGKGDIYARTLVGAVGGEPANLNAHSLEDDDLSELPYSAADIHRFGCGDVGSGESFTKDRFIFDLNFSDSSIALLYIQIGLWDEDGPGMPDHEVGVLSISWPAKAIFDMIEHPDEATKYGDGISISIVHPVETYEGEIAYVEGMPEDSTQEYYYIITDTREVLTRMCRREDGSLMGYEASRITYEIWVQPAS